MMMKAEQGSRHLRELKGENDALQKAEKALRESEERFGQIAETIDEIFWIFDLDTLRMNYLSPAYDRIFGYPRECLYDGRKTFIEPIHPEDQKKVLATLDIMKSGQPLDYEHRIIRPDKSVRHLRVRGFPRTDATGAVKTYIGVTQDVTAWRAAEEDLKQSRESLNRIINCIGAPIFVKDDQHRFVLVNDAFCTFSNVPKEELIGKSDYEFLPRDVAARIWDQEEVVYQTGRESETEEDLPDGRGESRSIMTKKALLADHEGKKQLVGTIRDITEHKRLEAQFMRSQKMEAVGVLAGGVAHDFNNLLSVIKGYTELLLEELPEDAPGRSDLEQIEKAAQRAASLISRLLAFRSAERCCHQTSETGS